MATLGLLAPVSQLFPVDEMISSVILLVGLAVGVDYSLFYLRRERAERQPGSLERARPGDRRRDLRPRRARLRDDGR